jgi:hypothetical protein
MEWSKPGFMSERLKRVRGVFRARTRGHHLHHTANVRRFGILATQLLFRAPPRIVSQLQAHPPAQVSKGRQWCAVAYGLAVSGGRATG